MEQISSKLKEALDHWDYNKLLATKEERAEWLEAEATYIKGTIYRATKVALKSNCRILQIGAGPCDVIDHWHNGERHAIDPLAKQYKEKFHEFQDKSVKYIAGGGENLPYEDNYFDIVIIRNALDHVDDPWQTLREVFRVLKPSGWLYVWIYLYSWHASLVYRLFNALTKRYEVEPWAFTWGRFKKCLSATGFIPRLLASEEIYSTFPKSENLLDWLKQSLRIALALKLDKGLMCVALPNK